MHCLINISLTIFYNQSNNWFGFKNIAWGKCQIKRLLETAECESYYLVIGTFVLDRTTLLLNGIEKYIRKAKQTHSNCKDAATDALRDLGLDNYNL